MKALRGDKTVQEIAAKHQLHPNQVGTWKRQDVESMADVFSRGSKPEGPPEAEIKELLAKIRNEPCRAIDPSDNAECRRERFFVRRAEAVSPEKKRAMIKRDHLKLVRLSRSAFYCTPVRIGADTLVMMKEIDRVFTKYPFFHCPIGDLALPNLP